MKLVSVVIPVWNHAKELEQCLESLSKQTYAPLEIIVVDDGSTDRPVTGNREPGTVRLIRLEERRGAAGARNEGARLATGDYLIFVDADAILVSHAIERMVATLESHPDASFVYSSFRFGWKRFPSRAFDADALRRGPYIHTTALMRRSAFPGFDESLKKFQDWDLWLTIVERGGKGIWIPEELFTLSIGRKGMSVWLPSFVHRLPWAITEEMKNYRHWEGVVKKKHGIES
ncbi:hypothetical protein A3E39_02510 [Candidatus Uhrbacteria bacterium RIFCSPHIGHO2_12_FULL_60_25]|uniref:Glycosyltransferase 2-like domain-containing protein n=1 Tax=Candidatus Uhrbacteria bacterium RIFCSPHIGHO2_12_FULL_60_25 TaxID=1802399 RepID=A0A1F7UMV8_9BACT|nr:MAG: hypothetical protein A3D73_00575 [Candidatus Uhrbacteria bacterium RIFCSPHIGHO2_02_FULL_60_44]OGL79094.1 MAG: hypothetical protein A3E39_02510 [Candidatus Uhrbacteria bacterium RIFCSPHIGHO2_12_FULL_60_25]